ncbi:hypothetical protein D3C78_782160 [compost metagenome]
MEQLAALGVAVVQHVVVGQLAEELVVEVETRGKVVVVVERDFQQRHAGLLGPRDLGEDVLAGEGDVVHAGAAIAGQRVGDRRVAVLRDVQRQADVAAAAADRPALHQPVGIGQHHLVVGLEVEQALVEQHPAVQAVGRQRHGHVVDALQTASGIGLRIEDEVVVVDGLARLALLHQVDQAAVGGAHGGDFALVGADQATERLAPEGLRALQRMGAVTYPQRGGAQRRAVGFEEVVGEGIRLAVEDDVDVALAQQADVLRAVLAGAGETELFQPAGQTRTLAFVDGEFEELHTVVATGRRRREEYVEVGRRHGVAFQQLARLLFQVEQRAQAIRRIGAGRRGAETVVEDFQRQRPSIAAAQDRREEARQVELALPREAAEMPAPLQHIHGQQRRVGHLHEEDLVAGDIGEAGRIALDRQGMEAVEQHAQCRMIGLADDVPHLLPGVHMTAPGKRLVADTQPAITGALGQLAEVVDEDLLVAQRIRHHVAADQHQVGAKLLHQVELPFGAVEVLLQAIPAAALEIAERLEQRDGDAEIGAHLPNLARAAGVVEKVVLEDLHAVETGGGNGFEFFRQGAAQGDGGNRALHAGAPVRGRPLADRAVDRSSEGPEKAKTSGRTSGDSIIRGVFSQGNENCTN